MPNQIEDAVVPSTDEQLEDIKAGARLLFNHRQLVEVRASGTDGYWKGFYFTDHERMAQVVKQLDADSRIVSIYYVFNQIDPKFIEKRQKCECKICARGGLIVANPTPSQIEQILTGPSQHLTKDEDIVNLNWLFIDVDTIRAPGHEHDCSTQEEKKASKAVAMQVKKHLADKGWPQPLVADSGNGFHILQKINLTNTQDNLAEIIDCLKTLAAKFNCSAAKIDDSVKNAARLTRAYGTSTRKGESTEERPHRRNRVYIPEKPIVPATFDQLLALSSDGPKTRVIRGDMPMLREGFDPNDFFKWYEDQDAFIIEGTRESDGKTIAITDKCLIAGYKHTGSKATGFVIGDTFGYHCWSPECNDPTIGDVLSKLNEDGFKRYPKKIWIEEDVSNFAEDVTALEQAMAEEKQKFETAEPQEKITKADLQGFEIEEDTEDDPFQSIEVKVAEERAAREEPKPDPPTAPPPEKKAEPPKAKPERFVGKEPNELAVWLLGVIFRDPEKAYPDYVMYKNRLEKIAKHFKVPIAEAFACTVLFEIDIRRLPTRSELKDYILNHPTCKAHKYNKQEVCDFIDSLKDDKSKTFDVTVQALIEEVNWRLEKKALLKAYDALEKERDIIGFRTALRKHWASSMTQDSNFQPGSWQESVEDIRESFRRDVAGEGDERKFKLGFPSIDDSGMNVGLDGEHAVVICGPASSRKTTAALTFAYNFAKEGKHGLFFAGEHQAMKIKKRLTLMFSEDMREEVGIIPGLNKWEGNNRTADWDDYEKINVILNELKMMRKIPGFLEPQNINAIARGEEDRLQAVLAYAEATYKKYQWDFIVIDPLDTIMPPSSSGGESNWKACSEIVDKLFDFSRDAFGGKGCMVVTTAQFNSSARREIEKVQQKNAGPDSYDDEIVSLLKKDSSIQYFTTIGQRFDLCLGVATRTKGGNDGMMVQGRSREGGYFDVVNFKIDPDSNLMREKDGAVAHRVVVPNEDERRPDVIPGGDPYDAL